MSSYNNTSNNDNNSNEERNHLGYNDSDLYKKIQQIKANKALKGESSLSPSPQKQGPHKPVISVLGSAGSNKDVSGPIIMRRIEDTQQEQQEQKKEEFNNPSTFTNESVSSATDGSKDYSYYQSQIQSKFAQFQGERINEIAKLARKDKHEILLFKEQDINVDPNKIPDEDNAISNPNISNDQYVKSICDRQVYRIKPIPNTIHVQLDEKRAEVTDLQRVKALASSSVSDKGIVAPAQMIKNDASITGIDDNTFANISSVITKKQESLYKLMAFYFFGIGNKTYERVETTSFLSAVEAAQYREQFGLVESSKNSTSYLT